MVDSDFVLLASKVAGSAAAVLASVMKVPQVVRLFNAKTDRGISLVTLILELYCYSLGMLYGYLKSLSLTAYGEVILLAFQDIILVCMVFAYRRQQHNAGIFCVLFVLWVLMLVHIVPEWLLVGLFIGTLPVLIVGKGAQIAALYKSKTAGSVSLTTWMLATFCCGCRVFTTIVQVKDPGVLVNYTTAFTLNLVIVAQMLYYQRRDVGAKRE